jgi:hypothetical protein
MGKLYRIKIRHSGTSAMILFFRRLSVLATCAGGERTASMDHSSMDHSGMDMGGDRCSMNVRLCWPLPVLGSLPDQYQMLFTWSTHNLCIVFRQWRITGTVSLLVSLAAIALLTAGYEGVRQISRLYEQSHATRMSAFSSSASSKSPLLFLKSNSTRIKLKLAR